MSRTHMIAPALLTTWLIALVVGCGKADQDDIEWEKVGEQNIVSLDDSMGVYVTGHFGLFGGGEVESRGVIDYTYARVLDDGGIRQDLISSTWSRFSSADYPGADVVTIYQDAETDGSDARIEIYECHLTNEWSLNECSMPDGGDMHGTYHRVDIHVPPGSVIERFSEENKSAAP